MAKTGALMCPLCNMAACCLRPPPSPRLSVSPERGARWSLTFGLHALLARMQRRQGSNGTHATLYCKGGWSKATSSRAAMHAVAGRARGRVTMHAATVESFVQAVIHPSAVPVAEHILTISTRPMCIQPGQWLSTLHPSFMGFH